MSTVTIKENQLDLTNTNAAISTINGKIPAQATSSNQLADKAFVNSSIQTSTAHFRGNWDTWAEVPTDVNEYPADEFGVKTPGPNDYIVVQADESQDGGTWRYKYSGVWATDGKNGWQAEYEVNETPLTAEQLAALNSGITDTGVAQITTNKNAISALDNAKLSKTEASSTYLSQSDASNTYATKTLLNTELAKKASNVDGSTVMDNGTSISVVAVKEQNASAVMKQWVGTKEEFDALATKDNNTFYHITNDTTESGTDNFVFSLVVRNIVPLTQAEYDDLQTKDANTLYLIKASNS